MIKNKNKTLLILIFYACLSFIIYRFMLEGNFSPIPENAPFSLDNWFKAYINTFSTYSEYQSISGTSLQYLNFRIIFYIISIFLKDLHDIIFLEYIFVSTLSGLGMFILTKDIISRSKKTTNQNNQSDIIISSFFSGIIYMTMQSFLIDSYWFDIYYSIATFPFLIFIFNKIMLDRKYNYIILFAFLFASNRDDHLLVIVPVFFAIYYIFLWLFVVKNNGNNSRQSYSLRFVSLFILCVLFILPRLLVKFSTYSDQLFVGNTHASIDIFYKDVSILDFLDASVNPEITIHSLLYQDSVLMKISIIAKILIIVVSYFSIILLLYYKKTYRKAILIFFPILSLFIISIWYPGSPLKPLHYLLVLKTPFGVAYRTWRIPDLIIAISISSLFGLSVFIISNILSKFKNIIYVSFFIILMTSSVMVLSNGPFQLLKGINIPKDYAAVNKFLENNTGDYKILSIPDYGDSQNANYKPFWSPNGMIADFSMAGLSGNSFNGIPIQTYISHYYGYTLNYRFATSLLNKNDVHSISMFLSPLRVKYLIVHNDIDNVQLTSTINNFINNLTLDSNDWKLVFSSNTMFIFENLNLADKIFITDNNIIINGGLESGRNFINKFKDKPENYSIIYSDQTNFDNDLLNIIPNSTILLSIDSNKYEIIKNLAKDKFIIWPVKYTQNSENNKWTNAYLTDPNQGAWHYISANQFDPFRWDHDYNQGIAVIQDGYDKFSIPLNINKGNYVILVRYFKNDKGGNFQINIAGNYYYINSKGGENGFIWSNLGTIQLDNSINKIDTTNFGSYNAINTIILIPSKEYEIADKTYHEILNNKTNYYIGDQTLYLSKANTGSRDNIVIKYIKYSSDHYIVKVDASKPFMLAFTEPYDVTYSWRAYIGQQEIKPIPLFSVINGFWINKTGEFDIEVKQKTQHYFEIGFLISIFTIFICSSYLIYSKIRLNKFAKE